MCVCVCHTYINTGHKPYIHAYITADQFWSASHWPQSTYIHTDRETMGGLVASTGLTLSHLGLYFSQSREGFSYCSGICATGLYYKGLYNGASHFHTLSSNWAIAETRPGVVRLLWLLSDPLLGNSHSWSLSTSWSLYYLGGPPLAARPAPQLYSLRYRTGRHQSSALIPNSQFISGNLILLYTECDRLGTHVMAGRRNQVSIIIIIIIFF